MYSRVVLLGVAVSVLFTELTGLSPAGLIVPGYIALCAHSPWRIVYTLCLAAATALFSRALRRVTILYGRRLFAVMILVSFALNLLVVRTGLLPFPVEPIGYLVPGIIARDFDRQGYLKTLAALVIATGVLLLLMVLCGWPVRGIF